MAFRYTRRVQFAETDMAGIVHFAEYFRYLEEAEHALWRAAGQSIVLSNGIGWPRVSARFDYKAPLHFEDEFEIALSMGKVTRSTVTWECRIMRGETLIGEGATTTVHITRTADGKMRSAEIPPPMLDALRAVAGE